MIKKIIKNFSIFLFVIVLCVSGCSGKVKLVPVSGTLTYKGSPLFNVRIEFFEISSGSVAFAFPDIEGRFKLTHIHGRKGAELGKYRISVFGLGKPVLLGQAVTPEILEYLKVTDDSTTSATDIELATPKPIINRTKPKMPSGLIIIPEDQLIPNSDQSFIEIEVIEGKPNDFVIDLK
ncbi:MAG: hypothetical protein LBT09_12140 [Planctomycetaceae bacterium]|jgi:hypothetical protein|nr:hypothetical protein [Planctomycetaceae bacterium]